MGVDAVAAKRGSVRGTGFGLVAMAAALWGSDALFRRGLALDLPSSTVVFYEHLILVAVTAPLLRKAFRTTRGYDAKDWTALVLVGAGASAIATLLFTAAFRYGDPTTPLLLQKLQPLVAVAGAALLLGERLRPRYGIWAVVAISGAYLIHIADPTSPSIAAAVPALLAVGAAALWGMGTVLGRHLTKKTDFRSLTALRFAFGLPASAAAVGIDEGGAGFTVVGGGDLLPLVLLALVPGLAALLLYYRGLTRTPAALATLAELAFPVAAISINYVAFDAVLTGTQWVGLGILTGAITLMTLLAPRGEETLGVRLTGRPALEAS
ncbi:MAG: DMT family transporter [Nitriliruptorales bacterium]